jgi:hypothetical protein
MATTALRKIRRNHSCSRGYHVSIVHLLLAVPGLLMMCSLALAGCSERAPAPAAPAEPASPPPIRVTGDGPRITFETTEHDFGPITDTRTHTASFRFGNSGTETLVISDVSASCGCTIPELGREELPPGESDTIKVTFNPRGRSGDTDNYIKIVSNAQPEEVVQLRIKGRIEPMVHCERIQRLGVLRLGREHTRMIPLSYDDPDLVIRDLTVVNNPHVTARLAEMGRAARAAGNKTIYKGAIELTLSKDAPWGIFFATRVKFTAFGRAEPQADPIEHVYSVNILGNIVGELRAEPTLFTLGPLAQNRPFEKAVTISHISGAPFTVTGAHVSETTMPGVEARVEPLPGGAHRIVVYGTTGAFFGGYQGVVTINTDVPGEETLTIRFAGRVR